MPTELRSPDDLKPGDIYEDCAYHPVLCLGVDAEEDEIRGISLIDGSHPRSCSVRHCGIRKLTLEEALKWKISGPEGIELGPEFSWW